MSTLKAFNANGRQKEAIYQKGERLRQAVMGQLRVTMLENVVLQFFAGLGNAFAIAIAAYQCAGGHMEPDALVYALFLIGACFAPMSNLINAWHMGYRGVVASYSIVELQNQPVRLSLLPKEGATAKAPASSDVRFENVSFAYDPADGDVLHGVSFDVPARTTTALVGASGSGKSTIAQLLAGFYPVRAGSVCVGGQTLSEQTVGGTQDQIAAVWQDCHLFYGTVEDNIRMGKPDATREEIEQAAKEASIHDFISSLPDGYQTMLGERGMRFSGGERQRVALARAFLRDAPIVILDEATSSLDRKNEIEVQRSFHNISAAGRRWSSPTGWPPSRTPARSSSWKTDASLPKVHTRSFCAIRRSTANSWAASSRRQKEGIPHERREKGKAAPQVCRGTFPAHTGFRLYLTLAILCNLMFKLLPLATSLVTSYMVSSVLLGEAGQVVRLLAACGVLVILLSLFSYLDVQVSHDMAYRILTKLRDQCYAKLTIGPRRPDGQAQRRHDQHHTGRCGKRWSGSTPTPSASSSWPSLCL